MSERCQLIDNAKVLAKNKNLDASAISCPYLSTCTGENCEMIGEGIIYPTQISTPKPSNVDRFYMRLMAHNDITKGGEANG